MPRTRETPLTDDDRRAQNRARQQRWLEKNRDLMNQRRRDAYASKHPKPTLSEASIQTDVLPVVVPVVPETPAPAPVYTVNDHETLKARLTEVGGSNYHTQINTLAMFFDISRGIERILKPGLIEYLRQVPNQNGSEMSVNSRKQLLQALLWTIHKLEIACPPDVFESINDLFEAYKILSREEHENAVKEAVPWWEDYLKNLRSKYSASSKENVVARMYSELPLRDDFKGLKIRRTATDDAPNYILVPQVGMLRLVVREYKTAGRYDPVDVELSPGLSSTVRTYIEKMGLEEGGTLFGLAPLGPFLRGLNASLGYGLNHGVNYYRYMSAPVLGEVTDPEERVRVARSMKHSTISQRRYMRPRLPADHWK